MQDRRAVAILLSELLFLFVVIATHGCSLSRELPEKEKTVKSDSSCDIGEWAGDPTFDGCGVLWKKSSENCELPEWTTLLREEDKIPALCDKLIIESE